MKKPVYVTQPYLPPLDEFMPYLEKIWDKKVLTNGGPFHQQLEAELCNYLGVKHIALFTNATIALVTALQALRITGEVITTPYSFVATSHSLLWNGIKPPDRGNDAGREQQQDELAGQRRIDRLHRLEEDDMPEGLIGCQAQ